MTMTVEDYMAAIPTVTKDQVAAAARSIRPHTSFFLKGVSA